MCLNWHVWSGLWQHWLIIERNKKHPNCPSADEWLNKFLTLSQRNIVQLSEPGGCSCTEMTKVERTRIQCYCGLGKLCMLVWDWSSWHSVSSSHHKGVPRSKSCVHSPKDSSYRCTAPWVIVWSHTRNDPNTHQWEIRQDRYGLPTGALHRKHPFSESSSTTRGVSIGLRGIKINFSLYMSSVWVHWSIHSMYRYKYVYRCVEIQTTETDMVW